MSAPANRCTRALREERSVPYLVLVLSCLFSRSTRVLEQLLGWYVVKHMNFGKLG